MGKCWGRQNCTAACCMCVCVERAEKDIKRAAKKWVKGGVCLWRRAPLRARTHINARRTRMAATAAAAVMAA